MLFVGRAVVHGGLSPTFRSEDLGAVRDKSMWALWWTKWQVGEDILRMIHFSLSVLFQRLSVLTLSSPLADAYKRKTIPSQDWTGHEGSRRLRLLEFIDSRHMKVVRFTALLTSRLYPRVIMRKGGLSQWKIQWLHQESIRPSRVCGRLGVPLKNRRLGTIRGAFKF